MGGSGIVLFAHGSRDARWREPVEAVARRVAELAPHAAVRCAYLELVEPGLPQAVAELAAGGVRAVRVVPLFLGMGRHLRQDLPGLLDDLRRTWPRVAFELAPAVGESPALIDLIARLALQESNSGRSTL
ncbi:MAG: CbiX/SirB N-terminal domain-containing protein [Xenophilus sp.]